MAGVLEINGKKFYPIKDASQEVSYSRDYITRLAREQKIIASHIGRQWFVDIDSLKQYIETISVEQEIRKKQLSDERKREQQIRAASEKQHTLHLKKAKTLPVRAAVVASLVLGFGLLSGATTHQLISPAKSSVPRGVNANFAQVSQPLVDSRVVTAEESPANLSENKNQLETPSLNQELRPIGDVTNGILLLPSNSSSTTVEELFSDSVVVRSLPDGTQAVVRVNANGKMVGNEVPFVTVPVEHEKK